MLDRQPLIQSQNPMVIHAHSIDYNILKERKSSSNPTIIFWKIFFRIYHNSKIPQQNRGYFISVLLSDKVIRFNQFALFFTNGKLICQPASPPTRISRFWNVIQASNTMTKETPRRPKNHPQLGSLIIFAPW